MRRNIRHSGLVFSAGVLISLVFSSTYLNVGFAQQVSVANPPNVAGFNDHINQYMALHDAAVKKLPNPGKQTAKPEKIENYEEGLANLIRTTRTNAKQGDIFTPEVATHFRKVIKAEFTPARLKDLKMEANGPDVQGVPLRVNYPYPETKELVDTPATLLLKLPQLPKGLGYHFAKRNLLLIDREARIIVDYIPNALP